MNEILSSWKEIADFLGKGVRTAQRWERELGLPIRRPPGKDSRVVFALCEELTAWVKAQPYTGGAANGAATAAATGAESGPELQLVVTESRRRASGLNRTLRQAS